MAFRSEIRCTLDLVDDNRPLQCRDEPRRIIVGCLANRLVVKGYDPRPHRVQGEFASERALADLTGTQEKDNPRIAQGLL